MNASPRLVALAFLLLLGCGKDNSVAGKGVITETTNGVAARGRLVTTDSVPVVSGQVLAVIDEDVPEAWNGYARGNGAVGADGRYTVSGLNKPKFILYAQVRDGQGRSVGGQIGFAVAGDSDIVLPDLQVVRLGSLSGTLAGFDSIAATLTSGWKIRVKVRGLGWWAYLDSTGGWKVDSLPGGIYHVRVEKVDGIPGHETTIWEDSLATR
jgi:hypothetical protein